MEDLEKHRILVIGWPLKEPQAWLKNYPFVDVGRIYQEGLSRTQKRWLNTSFHTPKCLQLADKLKPAHWYGDWREHVAEYDTIIIRDEIRGRDIFEYILKHNPQCRICVFYDSPIKPGSQKAPSNYRDLPVHFYTCDRKIAQDYGIDFIPFFYIFSPVDFTEYDTVQDNELANDVFFLGEEKGDRLEALNKLRTIFDQAGVKHDLRLVRKRHGQRYSKAERAQTTEYMSYTEYLNHIRQSKVILELVSNGQTGITQRPYEALFLGKKLITTSAEVKNYPFYCPENILVIDTDNPPTEDIMRDFINSPVKTVDDETKAQFKFSAWLSRMME